MSNILIYTKAACPYCHQAKELLTQKDLTYTEIVIDANEKKRDKMIELSGGSTVPQILINGKPIGGFDDLSELNSSGQLDALLKNENLS